MSYELRIWEQPPDQPKPMSFDDVARAMLALESIRPGVNPKFVALGRAMAERHRTVRRDAARDPGAVWMSDPAAEAATIDDAVWVVGIPPDNRVRVAFFVTETAASLGLTVLDEQLGMAVLPDGRVLPQERAALWQGLRREIGAERDRPAAAGAASEPAAGSSTLLCWSFPSPHSLEHAVEVLKGLPRSGRSRNPAFVELVRQLTARFPASDAATSVWSGGAPDGVTDSAVLALAIRSDKLNEVRPFVVETATTAGLVVFDEQQREVHQPGGITLTANGRRVGRHLGLPTTGPLSAALVERTLADVLLTVLAPDGFQVDRSLGGLRRSDVWGTQSLQFQMAESSPDSVAFDIEIVIVLEPVKKSVEAVLRVATQGREKHVATARGSLARACRFFRMEDAPVEMQSDGTLRFELRSVDALRSLGIALRWLVIDHLVPKLDDWRVADGVAMSLFNTGHDWVRSVGSLVRSDAHGFRSALIGGRLLDTSRCGGPITRVLIAAFAQAPMIHDIIDAAYRDVAELTGPALATEKTKLDECLLALRGAGIVT